MPKATTADILARLARGECANYLNNSCQGRTPCTVIIGSPCDYFAQYVKPLLEYPEFSDKYGREAKVTVALNPKAKVLRQRRQAGANTLPEVAARPAAPTTPAAKPPPAIAKTAAKSVPPLPQPVTAVERSVPAATPPRATKKTAPAVPVLPPAVPRHTSTPTPATPPAVTRANTALPDSAPLLILEIVPEQAVKRPANRRR